MVFFYCLSNLQSYWLLARDRNKTENTFSLKPRAHFDKVAMNCQTFMNVRASMNVVNYDFYESYLLCFPPNIRFQKYCELSKVESNF